MSAATQDHYTPANMPDSRPEASYSINLTTGAHVRQACRYGVHTTTTAGLAKTFIQANLIILPSRYASDFRLLCARNPVPCPLIAESEEVGRWDAVKSWISGLNGHDVLGSVDIRRDAPKYMVYKDNKLLKSHCDDLTAEWTEDHVAFVIGCSFSFESALSEAALSPRHVIMNRTVPMYRTNIPLCPAGVFTGSTYVVSMRPYKKSDIENVRTITRSFAMTHGEPIAWSWDAIARLGIKDIDIPDWGTAPLAGDGGRFGALFGNDDDVPVFWGCGVTPQEAVMRADLKGTIMGHAPGHMLVLDCRDWDIVTKS
ncbi:hypothetical protein G7Y89_g6962 [Cudoniella acicularis]|uniref:DUF1445 domain-containing protein n=1 Tax=Cudoniella acicularis TaxID=354080 RepID=A0A8H4W505_9HELO|nr:hypothetical protein G7Y89_g6962 [Cudoniella acicularis]